MNTVVEQYIATDIGDNSFPVLAADPLATVGSDSSWDALNPACWPGGTIPSAGVISGSTVFADASRIVYPSNSGALVTFGLLDITKPPSFNGQGLVVDGSTKLGLKVLKAGIVNYRVWEPVLEGFVDFLTITWCRVSVLPSSSVAGIGGCGQFGGNLDNGDFTVDSAGNIHWTPLFGSYGTLAAGQLMQIAGAWRFNVGANTATLQPYLNGAPIGSPVVCRVPTLYTSTNTNCAATLGRVNGVADLNGIIYRIYREYIGLSGRNPDTVVAQDYANRVGAFT